MRSRFSEINVAGKFIRSSRIQELCLCEQRQTLCEILCNYLRRKVLHVEITFELFSGQTIFQHDAYVHDYNFYRCVLFSCFKGRSLVENAWNGHQTIVWEDFRLFSTNDGYLWRRVYFLCKSSIMSILYRGTANLLVKSAGYAVISCIKGKI